jgi:hypothetical protein
MTVAVINPRKDLERVAKQMHRALKSKACGCGKRVLADGKTEFVQCGGCAAIDAYEAIAEVSCA